MDLYNGVAPLVKEDPENEKQWKRILVRVLNAI